MARHRSNRRSSAFPVSHRPGNYSRSTYRQLYRQPRPGAHERPVRIRQRSHRQHVGRGHVRDAQGAALRPHWELGFPGIF